MNTNDETRKILDLLAQGKITVDEAQQLMSAISGGAAGERGAAEKPAPRFLRITVVEAPHAFRPKGKTVNIRVPMAIVRGGIRLGALIPGLSENLNLRVRPDAPPLDFSKLDAAELERTLKDLDDLSIEVDQGKKQVQFHCEY
jgi:hypothetical protein